MRIIIISAIFDVVLELVHCICTYLFCFAHLLTDDTEKSQIDSDRFSSVCDSRINRRLVAQVKQVSYLYLLCICLFNVHYMIRDAKLDFFTMIFV